MRINLAINFAILLPTVIVGCGKGATSQADAHQATLLQSSKAAVSATSEDSHVDLECERLLQRISNTEIHNLDGWGMEIDHLFIPQDKSRPVAEPSLREQCFCFVRRRGGLDALFAKLISTQPSPKLCLSVSKALVFWIGEDEPSDALVKSTLAEEVAREASKGKFDTLGLSYPYLGLRNVIVCSASKAMRTR